MPLYWSLAALGDRESIFDFIALDNPDAAIRVDELIGARIELLADFPLSGRIGRVAGTRELVVSGAPYIVAYQVKEDAVLILRVLHGAMQWPETV